LKAIKVARVEDELADAQAIFTQRAERAAFCGIGAIT